MCQHLMFLNEIICKLHFTRTFHRHLTSSLFCLLYSIDSVPNHLKTFAICFENWHVYAFFLLFSRSTDSLCGPTVWKNCFCICEMSLQHFFDWNVTFGKPLKRYFEYSLTRAEIIFTVNRALHFLLNSILCLGLRSTLILEKKHLNSR